MFDPIIKFYKDQFKVITIDFLGHGKSDRLEQFPVNLWFEEAMQTIALIESLALNKVHLLGTSGGAWVAINTALERPDLIHKVVADSFDGRTLGAGFADRLLKERTACKRNDDAIQFYRYCHGDDWEKIVDHDTESLLKMVSLKKEIFDKDISQLKSPLLLTASYKDDMIRVDVKQEYTSISKAVPHGRIHFFQTGFHPAVISNSVEFSKRIKTFLT